MPGLMQKYLIVPRFKKAGRIIRDEGLLSVTIASLQLVQKKQKKHTTKKQRFYFLAKEEDILSAEWSLKPYKPAGTKKSAPYTVNWVMSPPGKGAGGGHQNIFRFLAFLAEQGHTCRVYLYSAQHYQPAHEAQQVFSAIYPNAKVEFNWLKGDMLPADATFATGWETAYPVYNDKNTGKKFYFIQDFEPYFYPVGSEYILAENTYRMNFQGITAGSWLSDKLSKEYGMQCDSYDFGTDTNIYRFENTEKRKKIFFYARPVTVRRGFELGIMALQLFHEKRPDYEIVLAGWDVSDYSIPFEYKNLKTLSLGELSDVYNECAAGLVISLTNMSLLPLELLSSGVIPVVNNGLNNTKVSDNPYIKYALPSPDALANALIEVVDKKDLPQYAEKAADSIKQLSWDKSCRKLAQVLEEQLRG
jgi:glycosyltransferase involved in cell wall biosynthesis